MVVGENAQTLWAHIQLATSSASSAAATVENAPVTADGMRTPVRAGNVTQQQFTPQEWTVHVLSRGAKSVGRGAVDAMSALREVSSEWRTTARA